MKANHLRLVGGDPPEPPPPPPEPLIWTCGHCGCATFYLRSDSTTECAHCAHVSPDEGEWRRSLTDEPDDPEDAPEVEAGVNIAVVGLASSDAAQRRWLDRARSGDPVLLARVERDGTTSWWCEGVEGEAQKAWMIERLDRLKRNVLTHK